MATQYMLSVHSIEGEPQLSAEEFHRSFVDRFYEPEQLKQAGLIATLRQLHLPLAVIKAILPLEPAKAAERVRQFWAATETKH